MGLVSGSINLLRYRVSGKPGGEAIKTYAEAVRRYAFREPAEDAAAPRTVGWVNILDPFDSAFATAGFEFGGRIVLSLRIDERKVPRRLLLHHIRRAEEETKSAQGKEFLSKGERTEIKTRVLQDLYRRSLPTPAIFDLLWIPAEQAAYFTGSTENARTECENLFEMTFGFRLIREIPYTLMERHLPQGAERSMERLRPSVVFKAVS